MSFAGEASPAADPSAPARAVPVRAGEASLIEHVVYIIKENRTYDQLFGDLPRGNGDPSKVMFGADVTPNQRKLALDYVLLDNLYATGGNSANGHQWLTQANEVSYTLWPGYQGRSYPFDGTDPLAYSANGFIWDAALARGSDVLLVDTAGRLQIDQDLIEEVRRLKAKVRPDEVLLVADGALGQEAVNGARAFHEALQLTGLVLTKMDGDARGGAALSIKSITAVPIKFIGTGEKPADFEVFHPDRLASRILGMGDVVSLVEKAQENIDQAEAERMAEKLRKADFNLEDFLAQMQQIKKMGSMESILGMMPGMSGVKLEGDAEKSLARTEAIIYSMTKQERRRPDVLNGNRRLRIANGAGVKVVEVNQLLKQFQQMQKMMKMFKGGGAKKMMRQMEAMKGRGGLPGL
jgi:signal recognition particle GTPase